jgi:hypothetical protein
METSMKVNWAVERMSWWRRGAFAVRKLGQGVGGSKCKEGRASRASWASVA